MTSILRIPSIELNKYLRALKSFAIAFSGGVDSSYLAYAAKQADADFTCYYVKSQFQPEFELQDAKRLAEEIGARMVVINTDILSDELISSNPSDRCFHCKRRIMRLITKRASMDGYSVICDGTNASDEFGDRPGMRALAELEIRSPLRECALSKDEIRNLSKAAGLFTWDKPAYACLATRIPAENKITQQKLDRIERAEKYMSNLGFKDFRVRMPMDDAARIEINSKDIALFERYRSDIINKLSEELSIIEIDSRLRQ